MTIKCFKRAIIKVITNTELDVKKTYQFERTMKKFKAPLLSPIYKRWDYKVYAEGREILTRVFTPRAGKQKNTIVFFHGGGWVTENIDSYNNVCKNLSKHTDCVVISVEYRLAPEHPFPQGLDDCYEVAKKVYEKQKEENILPGKIILMGDSAGGNLAAAVSLRARDRGEFKVDSQVLLYPATYWDHSITSPFDSVRENGTGYILTSKRVCDYMELYKRSDKDLMNPYFAPLMTGDFSNQPKTLLITAEYDPLRDEGEEYGKRLSEAGNEVQIYRMKDALHGFISLGSYNVFVNKTYDLINDFLANSECR